MITYTRMRGWHRWRHSQLGTLLLRLLKKRCPDKIGAGGLPDVSGQFLKVPQDWGIQGVDSDFFSSLCK